MKTIVIIGGGFSGTVAAVNLARFCRSPLRVCLVNAGFPLGRGAAYGTRRPEHLLNVAARNMSALADHPNHFMQWLRTRTEYVDVPEAMLRETFLPRRVYGDYLRGLLLNYAQPVDPSSATIETIDDEAIDIEPRAGDGVVLLASGNAIEADKVLLATGNQPPSPMPGDSPNFQHPAYCPNPWQDWLTKLPPQGGTIVLLGTGLTTVDALLTLEESGWHGEIVAVSRHGLLPRSHFKGIEYSDFPPSQPESLGLAGLAAIVEEHAARLQGMGANPAIVVDKLRPHTQRIWQSLSLVEKREFLREHAPRWNVFRHRLAPQIHGRVSQALDSGQLRIVAGAIGQLASAGQKVRVALTSADEKVTTIDGGLVVNCTGPQTSFSATSVPLFKNLISRGLVQVDDMDMGLAAEADFALRDGEGRRSPFLYAIGPLLKGTLWETTAVPELRGQALRVAQSLLADCAAAERPPLWPEHVEVDVLEYYI